VETWTGVGSPLKWNEKWSAKGEREGRANELPLGRKNLTLKARKKRGERGLLRYTELTLGGSLFPEKKAAGPKTK